MDRIAALRLGTITYDRGRAPIQFGTTTFQYAALIAVVQSRDGNVGTGLAWTQVDDELRYCQSVRAPLAAAIAGADVANPYLTAAACHLEASRVDACRVSAAIEMALWDLAGRALGVPSYQLLGCRRKSLPAYVISADDFSLRSVSEYVELAQRFVSDGFSACKFHMWGEPRKDVAACQAIRDAVGDGVALMLDPAGRYGRTDAAFVGKAIEELGFIRFEDPLSPQDAAGYRWLAPRLSVPIVVNESLIWNAEQCAVAARSNTVQGFRMNIGRAGIGEAFRMGAIAEANGAELDIAAFAPRGGLEACFHMALASTATRWFEHHEASGLDEVPGISPGFTIAGGQASPIDGPGFGFEIDWHELEKHCAWSD